MSAAAIQDGSHQVNIGRTLHIMVKYHNQEI